MSPTTQLGHKKKNRLAVNIKREAARLYFDCGGQGCCIVSVKNASVRRIEIIGITIREEFL
jgi:hypothetical protein